MIYKNKITSELIEFIGINEFDYVFRYTGQEFLMAFFSISKQELDKYWDIQ